VTIPVLSVILPIYQPFGLQVFGAKVQEQRDFVSRSLQVRESLDKIGFFQSCLGFDFD
jgi:hypothetical protein